MNKPKVILFACPMWSSKFAIAHNIGWNLNLPIFSRDAIRNEVKEDLLHWDAQEFENRYEPRFKKLLDAKIDFILDASIDRKYDEYMDILKEYDRFIISIDISKEHLEKIVNAKEYITGVGSRLDKNYEDHKEFLKEHMDDVDLHITDENFKDRLNLTLDEIKEWFYGAINS
ncbi:MAG: hypothetical protein PHP08_03865 [Candidatus Dojkabacteria bacterium]|nr:hypothetical protein [Candidatus Dojkabacteria bacterium]